MDLLRDTRNDVHYAEGKKEWQEPGKIKKAALRLLSHDDPHISNLRQELEMGKKPDLRWRKVLV